MVYKLCKFGSYTFFRKSVLRKNSRFFYFVVCLNFFILSPKRLTHKHISTKTVAEVKNEKIVSPDR